MYDIVYHLKQRLHTLSPVERRIADMLLADIDAAAQSGIVDLARRAQVSVAAISRFAKLLDCDNVRELRVRLAEASAVGKRFLAEQTTPPSSALYMQIYADIESCLRRNLGGMQEQQVQALAQALASARMIYIFGMGGCSTVFALELQNRLMRLGRPVVAYSDAISMKIVAATLTPQDMVVALSISGTSPEILSAVDIARSYAARVAAITQAHTTLSACAEWVLPISIDETDFVFKPSTSRYAMLLAVDVLATTLALHLADDSREHLRRIKFALDNYRGSEPQLPLGD